MDDKWVNEMRADLEDRCRKSRKRNRLWQIGDAGIGALVVIGLILTIRAGLYRATGRAGIAPGENSEGVNT